MLVVIVATGATVRLTGSGPRLRALARLPAAPFRAEELPLVHRVLEPRRRVLHDPRDAGHVRRRDLGAGSRRGSAALAFAIFVGTLLQAPLGAITIHYHLNPWLVLSHFLLSVVVLTLGVALAVEVSGRPRGHASRGTCGGQPRASSAAAFVLIVSGTLATAAGPHPGSTVVRRLWSFEPAVYWHVRATAVFGLSFAVLLVWLVREPEPARCAERCSCSDCSPCR